MTHPGVTAPQPVRRVRVGETFDLAPGETAELADVNPDLGVPAVVIRISGGPGGMKGARVR